MKKSKFIDTIEKCEVSKNGSTYVIKESAIAYYAKHDNDNGGAEEYSLLSGEQIYNRGKYKIYIVTD